VDEELPIDLRAPIRTETIRMLATVRDVGWHIGTIRWENRDERTVGFFVRSPDGRGAFVICGENELLERLQNRFENRRLKQ
jgi:hypothetical protein